MKALLIPSLIIPLTFSTFPSVANDGETPAQEAVCDVLIGNTPGLYGLCVAYCEAQDAPGELSPGDDLSGLRVPHRKILQNYQKKMQDGDPMMPCVNYTSDCPAWSLEELEDMDTHDFPMRVDGEYDDLNRYVDYIFNPGTGEYVLATVYPQDDKLIGAYGHFVNSDPENNTNGLRTMELTPSEFEACKQQLLDHVTEIDL